ncbi:glucose/arabinose dehydrogenase [Sinorhizobium fredii]
MSPFSTGTSQPSRQSAFQPGLNFGWTLIDGDDRQEGMETAHLHSDNDTWAPSGIAFRGDELLSTSDRNDLKPIDASGDRFRDVLSVGDDLYAITTNRSPRGEGPSDDHLIKLSPKL